MSVYVRPFRASDYTAFVPIEPLSTDEINDTKLAEAIELSELAVTGIRDGKIVGCGGVHPLLDNPDQGEMWLRLSANCQKHPFDTLRWITDGMKIIEEAFPFKQLNATVQCCFDKSVKLIEYLGFSKVQIITAEGKQWSMYSKRVK